jgi:hypothetical protein
VLRIPSALPPSAVMVIGAPEVPWSGMCRHRLSSSGLATRSPIPARRPLWSGSGARTPTSRPRGKRMTWDRTHDTEKK